MTKPEITEACDETIWDGPYRMSCSYQIVNDKCVRHGKTSKRRKITPDRPSTPVDTQADGPTEIRGETANHGLTRITITGSLIPGLDGEYYMTGPVDQKLDQLVAERERLVDAFKAAWPVVVKLWQNFWTVSGLEIALATPATVAVEQCSHCHDDPPLGHRCPCCGAMPADAVVERG